MHDPETLAFYGSEACAYVARYRGEKSHDLAGFLDRLPPAGRVLELGCGGGGDTAAMLAYGFDVVPTDGSPEMAREASAFLGRPVQVLRFEDLEYEQVYDGVWASACLLHVPLADLSTVSTRSRPLMRRRWRSGSARSRSSSCCAGCRRGSPGSSSQSLSPRSRPSHSACTSRRYPCHPLRCSHRRGRHARTRSD